MPFASRQQQKFMFARHPGIARRWVAEAKRKKEPFIMRKDYAINKALRELAEVSKAGPPPPTWLANDPQPPRATWTNTPRSTKELLRTPKPRYVPERKLQMIRKPGSLRWVVSR